MNAHLNIKRINWLAGSITIGMILMAACSPAEFVPVTGGSSPYGNAAPTTAAVAPAMPQSTATTAMASASSEAVINVVTDPKLGQILVGNNGLTLYMFTVDGPDKSNCSGSCLKYWPPLLTQGNPTLGNGVDKTLVSSATMADGSKIVTYNHMPLYYYVKDAKPGDTTGQDTFNHTWFVVSPDGKAVGMPTSPTTAPTTAPTQPAALNDVTINLVMSPKLGNILVGDNGKTLYVFTKDGPNKSNCSGGCATMWPPALTHGNPTLGAGVNKSLIGTATLPDGSMILTYNKMPLYYFSNDSKPGDMNGQNMGNVWFTVSPNGKPAGMMSNPPATMPKPAAPSGSGW